MQDSLCILIQGACPALHLNVRVRHILEQSAHEIHRTFVHGIQVVLLLRLPLVEHILASLLQRPHSNLFYKEHANYKSALSCTKSL